MSTRPAPEYALSFSSDAVHLMERSTATSAAAAARWRERASAPFDAPDFRSEMARLPAVSREGVFRYWQRCRCPGDPVYLAQMVRQCRAGVSFWGKLAELRRFELIRLGRLPNPFLEREKRA